MIKGSRVVSEESYSGPSKASREAGAIIHGNCGVRLCAQQDRGIGLGWVRTGDIKGTGGITG